jgi:hypothetical protein
MGTTLTHASATANAGFVACQRQSTAAACVRAVNATSVALTVVTKTHLLTACNATVFQECWAQIMYLEADNETMVSSIAAINATSCGAAAPSAPCIMTMALVGDQADRSVKLLRGNLTKACETKKAAGLI